MSDDPYQVLGVAKDASHEDIRKAYRKLAKKLHPDLHPGDKAKEAEFQKTAAAHDLLGDAEKRKRYDAGEIDASGQERPERQFYRNYAGADREGRYASTSGFGDFPDASDVFADLFGRGGGGAGGGGGGRARGFAARGADLRYSLEVAFLDAAKGAKRTVPMPDGNTIELTIPAGVQEGQVLRLRGKGRPGIGGGPTGDAYVEITMQAHPVFTRDGNDIEVELPISFDEAVLGAKIEVPTISGRVTMTVPRGVSSGHRLRLKGKGVKPAHGEAGDQYVRLKIVLPERIDDAMEVLAGRWRDAASFDPRAKLWRSL